MKKAFYHGILSGLLAGLAGFIYNKIYAEAMWVDFSVVLGSTKIFSTTIFVCLIASLIYFFLTKSIKPWSDTLFNALFIIGSFASLILPFSFTLPLDLEFPELFIGLTVPMHFFPILFWMGTKHLFAPYQSK